MVDAASSGMPQAAQPRRARRSATDEGPVVRWLLIGITVTVLALFLLLPLVSVFTEALRLGFGRYFETFRNPDAVASIVLTLIVAAIAVPCNIVFGIAASWAIAKFRFPGRAFLVTLIDLPFSVSPVVSGMVYVLLLGSNSLIGGFLLESFGFRIIFAVPGIVLATIFVTFPFVARELIPLMEQQGTGDEEAAISLGATGLKTFLFVTLPSVKWALLYGVLLCNARAMGEFGAVTVLSGRLRGQTITMPLQIELFYNEYLSVAAFSLASVLAGLALVTLGIKSWLEWRYADELAAVGGRH